MYNVWWFALTPCIHVYLFIGYIFKFFWELVMPDIVLTRSRFFVIFETSFFFFFFRTEISPLIPKNLPYGSRMVVEKSTALRKIYNAVVEYIARQILKYTQSTQHILYTWCYRKPNINGYLAVQCLKSHIQNKCEQLWRIECVIRGRCWNINHK